MARRRNHPLKTFVLFVLLGGGAWAAWHYLHDEGLLRPTTETFMPQEERDRIRDSILAHFGDDSAFQELGPFFYRPKENGYRVEFVASYGAGSRARSLCEDIADLVESETGREAQVFAFDPAGNQMARYIP